MRRERGRAMRSKFTLRRTAGAALLGALSLLAAACSSELASIQDTYVPDDAREVFPIRVADRPLKITVDARAGGLTQDSIREVTAFAQLAMRPSANASPITVSYPAYSKPARLAADQAVGILASEGVSRSHIRTASYDGKSNTVTLTFSARTAKTRPCGDWSENLAPNQFNTTMPNLGCAVQQNTAAMVTNPEDFQHPRAMTPAYLSPQRKALSAYDSGAWTAATAGSSSSSGTGN